MMQHLIDSGARDILLNMSSCYYKASQSKLFHQYHHVYMIVLLKTLYLNPFKKALVSIIVMIFSNVNSVVCFMNFARYTNNICELPFASVIVCLKLW